MLLIRPRHLTVCRRFVTSSTQTHRISRLIDAPPNRVYEVVSQVQNYNKFVPFVKESFVTSTDLNGEPSVAGLRVGWKQFDEIFECELTCNPNTSVLANSLTISLFEYLKTEWEFKPQRSKLVKGEQCVVELLLSYKFKNPLYNTVSGMFSEQVTEIMIRAFESRVKELERNIKRR